MSGYNRSCSRADSSILLVAQCAAALSMMPTSAPSCWAQGVTAASYNEYAIWVSPSGGFYGRDHRGSPVLLPTSLPLPNTPFTPLPAASMSAVHPVSREHNPSLERSLLALLAYSLIPTDVRSWREPTLGRWTAIRVLAPSCRAGMSAFAAM